MSTIDQGARLLQHTEEELRQLLSEAAATGDYDSVVVLTRWASHVANLRSQHESVPSSKLLSSKTAPKGGVARRSSGVRPTGKKSSNKVRPKRTSQSKTHSKYPKFVRRNDDIIKIGWSKRSKSEYQHKAPRKAMSLLTAAIAVQATSTSLVTATDLIPLTDPSDNAEIPAYQVYVCLAWLRHEGLIEQKGRQGYVVDNPSSLEKQANDRWEAIPAK